MAAKLTSISRQIHWPLLIKAAIFAAAWWYLPEWLFVVVACGIYFFPFFEAQRNFPAFLVLLGVAIATAPSMLMAAIYGALFYYLLLIKDFLVVDRKSARTIFAMALSFLLFREFFLTWSLGISSGSLLWAWVVVAAFGILMNGVIAARRGKEIDDERGSRARHAAVGVSAFFIFEVLVACLFLPIDFIDQSIVVFLAAAFLLDLVPTYFFRELESRRIRTTAITLATLLVIVLASVKWRI